MRRLQRKYKKTKTFLFISLDLSFFLFVLFIYHRQLQLPIRSPPELTIRTTKYVDPLTNSTTIYRKPVRIVKAMQRSSPKVTSSYSTQYMQQLFPISDRFKHTQIVKQINTSCIHIFCFVCFLSLRTLKRTKFNFNMKFK